MHRNHLAVMSADSVSLSSNSGSYNFTDASNKFFGGSAGAIEVSGKWCMTAGDIEGFGSIDAADRNTARNDRNKTGYERSDATCAGNVSAADHNIIWNNRNKITQVPQ